MTRSTRLAGRTLAATIPALVLTAAPLLVPGAAVASAAPCTYQQTTEGGTPCYNAQTDMNNHPGNDFTDRSKRNQDYSKLQDGGY
jgi:hypothetical protein